MAWQLEELGHFSKNKIGGGCGAAGFSNRRKICPTPFLKKKLLSFQAVDQSHLRRFISLSFWVQLWSWDFSILEGIGSGFGLLWLQVEREICLLPFQEVPRIVNLSTWRINNTHVLFEISCEARQFSLCWLPLPWFRQLPLLIWSIAFPSLTVSLPWVSCSNISNDWR